MNAIKPARAGRGFVSGALLAALLLAPPAAQLAFAEYEYSIAELLETCVEGDNDSRHGAVAESECEQYLNGFTDAFLLFADEAKVCVPTVNRPDEMRWAFMRWAYQNYADRHQPAAQGVARMLAEVFKCS